MEQGFINWYEANGPRFAVDPPTEQQIAYEAWLESKAVTTRQIKEGRSNPPTYAFDKTTGESIPLNPPKHYLKIYNGRIKVYCDGYVMFSFNQIDFSGYYAFKDCTSLYGITISMNREKAGAQEMDIYFKTKETWLAILRLLDENL